MFGPIARDYWCVLKRQQRISDRMRWLCLSVFLGHCAVMARTEDNHKEVRDTECISCHEQEYAAARHPIHGGALSQDCASCHMEEMYVPAPFFEHSGYALLGAHKLVECNDCHTGPQPQYTGLPGICGSQLEDGDSCDCANCHVEDAATVTAPLHGGAMAEDCGRCHSLRTFKGAERFDHPAWELLGDHKSAPCNDCHTGPDPQYTGLSHACEGEWGVDRTCRCEGCHETDAQHVKEPLHFGTLSVGCDRCHGLDEFVPASGFDHPAWPLQGRHAEIACSDCHTGEQPQYSGLPHACDGEWGVDRACRCDGCHGELRAQGVGPLGHGEFPLECELCHTPDSWRWTR